MSAGALQRRKKEGGSASRSGTELQARDAQALGFLSTASTATQNQNLPPSNRLSTLAPFGVKAAATSTTPVGYTTVSVAEEKQSLLTRTLQTVSRGYNNIYDILMDSSPDNDKVMHKIFNYELPWAERNVLMTQRAWFWGGLITTLFQLALWITLIAAPSKTPYAPVAYAAIFTSWVPGQNLGYSQWNMFFYYAFGAFVTGVLMFGPACSYAWMRRVGYGIFVHGKNPMRMALFYLVSVLVVSVSIMLVYFQEIFVLISVTGGWGLMIPVLLAEHEKANASWLAMRNRENAYHINPAAADQEIRTKVTTGKLTEEAASQLLADLQTRASNKMVTYWTTFVFAVFALVGIMTFVFVYMSYVLSAPQVYGANYWVILSVPLANMVLLLLLVIFHGLRYARGHNLFYHYLQTGAHWEAIIWIILVNVMLDYPAVAMITNIYTTG